MTLAEISSQRVPVPTPEQIRAEKCNPPNQVTDLAKWRWLQYPPNVLYQILLSLMIHEIIQRRSPARVPQQNLTTAGGTHDNEQSLENTRAPAVPQAA